MSKSVLTEKSFAFAKRIVKLHLFLTKECSEYTLSKQVLRSGTSIGANIRESRNAESDMDFVHKLGIAQKEGDETLYWLELLYETGFLEKTMFESIYTDGEELLKIIRSSIITKKANLKK